MNTGDPKPRSNKMSRKNRKSDVYLRSVYSITSAQKTAVKNPSGRKEKQNLKRKPCA